MYLVGRLFTGFTRFLHECPHGFLSDAFEVFRRIDANRFVVGLDHFDANAVLQGTELLERLGPLERGLGASWASRSSTSRR